MKKNKKNEMKIWIERRSMKWRQNNIATGAIAWSKGCPSDNFTLSFSDRKALNKSKNK